MSIIRRSSIFHRFSSYCQTTHKIFTTSLSLSASSSSEYKTKFDELMRRLVDSKEYRKALELFQKQEQQFQPYTDMSVNMALKACTLLKDYERGVQIEKQLSTQMHKNHFIQTSLLQFYMRCGDMKNAERIYMTIEDKSNRMYAILFKGLIMNDMPKKVLSLVDGMKIIPDEYTLTMIFNACAKVNDACAKEIGMKFLNKMPNRFNTNIVLLTTALDMLMSFGDTSRADKLFESMKGKNTVSYGAMLKGYIRNNMSEKTLDLFERMSVNPDEVIYTLVFKACAQLNSKRAQRIGRQLVDQIEKNLAIKNTMWNSAINMLMRFDDIDHAEQLFRSLKKKDAISYGVLINGYVERNMNDKALDLFEQMLIEPNEMIYTLVFKACTQLNDERAQQIGRQLVDRMVENTEINNTVWNSAMHMLMRFGDVNRVEKLFESMENKDVVSYGFLMKEYVENNMNDKALDLFEQMSIDPDEMIFKVVFKACTQSNNERGKSIGMTLFDEIASKTITDQIMQTSAITMLMRFGDIDRAEQLFRSLKKKDVISYGVLINGYIERNMNDKALDLFEQMLIDPDGMIYTLVFKACTQSNNERGKSIGMTLIDEIASKTITNKIVQTSAINMLMNYGDIRRAEELFESMKEKDIVAFNTMMIGYNINNNPLKCVQLFQQIKQQKISFSPNICVAVLQGCAQVALPSLCHSIVAEIPVQLQNDLLVANSMINMWGRLGSIDQAYSVFASIKNPDIYAYNTMINAYGLNGQGFNATKLYQQMPDHLPDEITYICVLNACSHAGLAHQARSIFNNIKNKTKKIYTTIVDCFSRLQMFDEAEQLLQEYEQHSNESFLPMYMALLSGARNARNSDLSAKLYKKMEQLFPDRKNSLISGSILLANIYTSVGDYEQASAIRRHRIEKYGTKVKPGVTWTEVDGQIVSFTAHDRSHPLSEEIYAEARVIANELIEHGHQFDASWITRPLKGDETIQSVLCGHSERLALAFHFIRGRRPLKIHMVKNLRVCGDCHHATKLIAKIRQCEIIVRDANRIHHFQPNGQCSCLDHF